MRRYLLFVCALALAVLPGLGAALDQGLPEISVLPEEQIPRTPAGIRHYLLVCMDSWAADIGRLGFSDGMVLLTVDEPARRVIVTSFIRDMLVLHPDGKPGRLTYIVREYGVEGLMETLNRHFGLRIEKYVLMDWSQVQSIVDAVGGVDISVSNAEASYLRRYAISSTSTTPSMAYGGTYHFKGHAAVIYMRIRRVPATNGDPHDIGRTFRTRMVLSNIADKLSGITYAQATQLLQAVLQNILKTNMSMSDMLEAVNIAYSLRGTRVEQFRLPVDDSFRLFVFANGSSQLMDFELNRKALRDFLFEDTFIVAESEQEGGP